MGSGPDGVTAFRSRRVVTSTGVRPATVLVQAGRINDVVGHDQAPAHTPVTDFGDRVLAPGLVDSHVHVNEPGRTEWEGYRTATQAAAAGGITTIVDMPLNSTPVTTTFAALEQKLEATHEKLWVDTGFWGGLVPGNTRELERMVRGGVFGFKGFLVHSGIDDFPNVTEVDLLEAMPVIERTGVPLIMHAELDRDGSPTPTGDPRNYANYVNSRPHRWEVEAVELMANLCKKFHCPVHIVHLSSSQALPAVLRIREGGLPFTVETCPHYLTLKAETVPAGDTRFKCAPPIREDQNRTALWTALKDGVIDFVVSDHSPCSPELKVMEKGDFFEAWGGIASLQLGLSTTWTEARRQGKGVEFITELMSQRTARFLGLTGRKGAIAPGCDADFVVWDPDGTFVVQGSRLFHRHKATPYDGQTLHGVVHQTILRGETIFDGQTPSPSPRGRVLLNRR